MRGETRAVRRLVAPAVLALAALWPSVVRAQVNAGGNAGVAVDAKGVLQKRVIFDPTGQVMGARIAAARASLNRDVIPFSKMRKISLNRLEKALRDANGVPNPEMRYLAGLLRAKYVFFYPDTKDIVIAGPAEGWVADPTDRVVGLSTRRPVLQLQDLVVALRAFRPGKEGPEVIGCSIDPTPEGLQAMQQFLRSMGSTFAAGQEAMVAQRAMAGLQQSLGMQNITIRGISPATHFAQVLVEADYRMKLIGIGLEQPPIRMVSFVDKVNPGQVSRNALFRWYFVPDYHCVRVSEDRTAMELVGDGVKLIGEDEMIMQSGQREGTVARNNASQLFVKSFTQQYSKLADRSPVYAELRNLIDLAVLAAYLKEQDLYGKAGWKMELLGDEKQFAVETYNPPKQVAATVAAIMRGSRLMTPIGGGVRIEAANALKSENLLRDSQQEVAKVQQQVKLTLPAGQWWWD